MFGTTSYDQVEYNSHDKFIKTTHGCESLFKIILINISRWFWNIECESKYTLNLI